VLLLATDPTAGFTQAPNVIDGARSYPMFTGMSISPSVPLNSATCPRSASATNVTPCIRVGWLALPLVSPASPSNG